MKTLPKAVAISILALFGTLASGAAMADHYRHHHRGPDVRFGISLGVPVFGHGYYPWPNDAYSVYAYPAPSYVYPPVIVQSSAPPVYVERPQVRSVVPTQPQGDWYYCADAKAYYPYVTQCPAGWQRVPAQPPAR